MRRPSRLAGEARADAEKMGLIWTRAERRRLARSDSGPGRRFPARVPQLARRSGFALDDVEIMAILAVPGLRRRHVEVSVPQPGRARVRLSGPVASERAADAVYQALWRRMPVGVGLEVEAVVTVDVAAWV